MWGIFRREGTWSEDGNSEVRQVWSCCYLILGDLGWEGVQVQWHVEEEEPSK